MDITVIICIFNSNIEKLKRTIQSVICQKEVDYDIIIADDGSKIDNSEQIEEIFSYYQFENFLILRSEKNMGTVRNLYEAAKIAKGKFIFATSPGDMLYDDRTLKCLLDFSNKNHSRCSFGDAVCYCEQNEQVEIIKMINLPHKPQIFNKRKLNIIGKSAILQGHKICGATFFREKENFLKHLERVMGTTKYVEDTTTTLSYVLAGEKILHYPRKIVWYECGVGISTNKENKWKNIIKSEIDNTKEILFEMYKKDNVVKYARIKCMENNKTLRIIKCIFGHPFLGVIDIFIKMSKKQHSKYSESDKKMLENIINKNE